MTRIREEEEVLCLCGKFNLFLLKSTKKLLPPELLLLAQICTKLFVSCSFATMGAYSAPPDSLAGFFKGCPSPQGRGWREGRGNKSGRERKGGEGKGIGRDREGGIRGEAGHPQIFRWIVAFAHVLLSSSV